MWISTFLTRTAVHTCAQFVLTYNMYQPAIKHGLGRFLFLTVSENSSETVLSQNSHTTQHSTPLDLIFSNS